MGDRLAIGVLSIVLTGSMLALGGSIPIWFLPFGALAILTALAAAFLAPERRRVGPVPVLVLLSLAAFSLLQAAPMPLSWLERLSPAAADVWARCLLPVQGGVRYGTLSLDPSATVFEAFKWASYAATFYLGAIVARRWTLPFVLTLVFGVGLVLAFVSLGHAVLGATKVYGLYEPHQGIAAGHANPFLNANTLSGYLNLTALVGVGLILSRPPVLPRFVLGAGALVMVAVSIRAASRAGLASLLLGVIVFTIGVALARGSHRTSTKVAAYTTTGLLLAGAALAVIGADAEFWADLLQEDTTKLELPAASLPLVKDHAWFGVGRGAFESVFQAYAPPSKLHVAYTHPENFVVQWVAEWGVVVAPLAFGALAWCLSPRRLAAGRSVAATGAFAGVFALLLQNLADLGLELAGVGTALAAVLGALWSGASSRTSIAASRSRGLQWGLRGGLAFGALTIVLAMVDGTTTLRDDRTAVRKLLDLRVRDGSLPVRDELRGAVKTMSARHPADYYFPLAGAMSARLDGSNPMPWLQRALERGPTVGRNHLLLGEVLADYGFARQALLELKLAVSYEAGLAFYAAGLAVRLTRDPHLLLLAVPDERNGLAVLEHMVQGLTSQASTGALRELLDREAIRRAPELTAPRERLVDLYLAAMVTKAAPCSVVAECAAWVAEHAASLSEHAPRTTKGVRAHARLALMDNDRGRAAQLLEDGCNVPDERAPCFRLLAETLAADGATTERLGTALDAFTSAACAEKKECADAHAWVGALHDEREEHQLAVTSYQRAAREDPTVARQLQLAGAAKRAHLPATEIEALEEAVKLNGSDPQLEERLLDARARSRALPF